MPALEDVYLPQSFVDKDKDKSRRTINSTYVHFK